MRTLGVKPVRRKQAGRLVSPMPLETPDITPQTAPANAPMISASGFAPLKIALFRDRWIASTVSNLGTWMQDTAGTLADDDPYRVSAADCPDAGGCKPAGAVSRAACWSEPLISSIGDG